ncbi:M20 family peptidase [Pseudoflavonifractor sp. 60]|uniref:M20 family metallopeptidase n=1 Tax=Pseudoflavonifractor sp. 60 TaxID=2304576 RepID=UPI00137157FE|nr:M20/M25/M40 family metallo-hydrolase [Pseudoflavonifractor sp. 60]NBI67914.1 M20 family peptidase [Pseudoflavonifractor sp. 60]
MITVEEIKQVVAANREEAITLLVEALQSPSPTGYEGPMAETMLKWLDKLNIEINTYEYAEGRPNIIAEWKGSQPGKRFLFNGHMDVFPPNDGDNGLYGPWSGKIVDGIAYGRGACDMKSGDCAAYMAVKLLKQMGFDPKGSIVLNYVVDEENGAGMGTKALVNDGLLKADIGISMEPSDGMIKLAHGGVRFAGLKIYGDGGPAAVPLHENKFGRQDAGQKSVPALKALYELRDHIFATQKAQNSITPILSVTTIRAGEATNLCPSEVNLTIDRRYLPGESVEMVDEEIIAAMEAVKKEDPTFTYEYIRNGHMPPYSIDEDGYMVKIMDQAYEELFGEKPGHFRKMGGTDASYIRADCGVDMPWAGPGAHDNGPATPNESVPVDQYLNFIQWYMYVLVKTMG